MPVADFFTRFGLFIARDFFDDELCAALRSEMLSAPSVPGDVRRQADEYVVDEGIRKVRCALVTTSTRSAVEARLLALRSPLTRHFGLPLAGLQRLQFLIYGQTGMYLPHRDVSDDADATQFGAERRVSVSLFLNGEQERGGAESYCGGSLTFYGLFDDPRGSEVGLPLVGETGLLVAFPADLLHGVSAITHGVRYSIVSWFTAE